MAVRDVAKELKPGWDTAKALNKKYMEKQLRRDPVAPVHPVSFLKNSWKTQKTM
ncbi:MAG: hypothetical protein HS132_17635 [Planctomycetia bacterium]|nr:hypothetical protein [Planctomycetia bacterium]